MSDEQDVDEELNGDEREEEKRRRRRGLADSLLGSIMDSGQAFRRGQDVVTGVAQGTKEEILRIVGAEVRGFLDKVDVADLAQEIVAGLVVEIKTEVRFSRNEEGRLEPKITKNETRMAEAKPRKKDGKEPSEEPEPAEDEDQPSEG